MKKIVIILFSIFISFIIGLMIYSNNKITTFEYYSPNEAKGYVISSDREMSFDIYFLGSESLITNSDLNIYNLYLDDYSFKLEDVHVNVISLKGYTIVRIYSKIPKFLTEEYHSDKSLLEIINSKYKLRLSYGSISFLSEDLYKLASISSLYGSYSYMNGSLILSGINITLTNKYSYLSKFRIGNLCYGTLSKALYDTKLDNIVDISKVIFDYTPKRIEEEHIIALSSNELFIPLGYKNIELLRSSYILLVLDNETYYIDTFDFMTNYFDFNDYKEMMRKGEVIYA